MFKLDLEKAEELEVKLPTSVGSYKKQESSRKISTSASLTTPNHLTVDYNKMWKILNKMGIPDHLTCLLRNLYAGKEEQLEPDMEQPIGSTLVPHQDCILSPCLFDFSAEYIMHNAWMKHKLESRLPGEISTTLGMQVIPL